MTDREIVIRLQAGDQTAFEELYERYSGPMFRSARVLLGNSEDAEDVLQETFVTCYFHIGELERPESVRYWLFRIMRRSAYRLGKKRRAETPDEDINRLRDTAESEEIGPEDVACMMTLFKIARLQGSGYKSRDSWIDAIGYLACGMISR